MNEAKEKNGGPETKPTNKKKKQGAQVKIHKGKKKSIKKNSDATPVYRPRLHYALKSAHPALVALLFLSLVR